MATQTGLEPLPRQPWRRYSRITVIAFSWSVADFGKDGHRHNCNNKSFHFVTQHLPSVFSIQKSEKPERNLVAYADFDVVRRDV